ncbi:MAG: OsmC family peroxiredoxin, partial [Acidobacteriota bacterium]
MPPKHPDVIGNDPRPLFFPVANAQEVGLAPPTDRRGMSLRTWVRSLAGMQKEALVINGATGRAWRLTSDEGPYLAGHDVSPCPLSFLTTGMVSSYMNEIRALAKMRQVEIRDIELTLDNHYSMEGSALQGTMVGGALPPVLEVRLDSDAEPAKVTALVSQAIDASPINGLLRGQHTSLFTLTCNGQQIEVGRVAGLAADAESDPGDLFPALAVGESPTADATVRKMTQGDRVKGVKHGVNSSLQANQSRTLHVRGRCTVRPDGVKLIEQSLFKPLGSTF